MEAKRWPTILATVPVVLSLAMGCTVVDSPESAAKRWFHAGLKADGQTLGELTCAAKQEELQMSGAMLSAILILGQAFLGGQSIEADTSAVKFTTIHDDGASAQVRVTGTVRVSILAMWQNQPIDDTYYMVHEGGRWKWCGSQAASAW